MVIQYGFPSNPIGWASKFNDNSVYDAKPTNNGHADSICLAAQPGTSSSCGIRDPFRSLAIWMRKCKWRARCVIKTEENKNGTNLIGSR